MNKTRAIVLLLPAILLSSCGVFREVYKNTHKENNRTEISTETKTEEKEVIEDKSTVKTTETITAEAKSPEKNVTVKTPLDKLKDGEEIITLDSTGLLRVSILLDSLNNIITSVSKKEETLTIPNAGVRVIEEQRDVTTKRDKQDVAIREEDTKVKVINKDVAKTPKNSFWFVVMWVAGIAISLYIIIKVLKFKRWL